MTRPKRVLIIEDEPDIRLILSKCLEHTGSFDPIVACDGAQGIDIAKEQKPDVILIDALLPKMNGYAACQRIKKDSSTKHIPVIFLTAKTDRNEIDRAIKSGACGVIAKPFDPLQLAAQIENLIGKD